MSNYARIDDGLVAELLSTDGDITEMFHPGLVWIEVPVGVDVAAGWSFADGEFSAPPPPSAEQLATIAFDQRAQFMQWATGKIEPLQDAIDLGEATQEETELLKALKQYRVALNRLDQQEGWPSAIQWPSPPAA